MKGMKAEQRAAHAADCANLRLSPLAAAAKAFNVSLRSARYALVVKENGTPALLAAVNRGAIAVSDAAAVARLPVETQARALLAVENGEARTLRQAAGVLPLHDPRRVLPCPLASFVRALGGDLLVAPRGDLFAILCACRRAEDASAYSLARVEGPERAALAHFSEMVGALRAHVLALLDAKSRADMLKARRSEPDEPAAEREEIPS